MTEQEMRRILNDALQHLDMDNNQRNDLFNAIWENFENYSIITNLHEDQNTFLTLQRTRRFNKQNFIHAYQSNEMDIEDIVNILF